MTAILGRKVRVYHYPDGFGNQGTRVQLMAARTQGLNLSSGAADISDVNSGPWTELMDDLGEKSGELSLTGVLKARTLIDLYNAQGEGASLHDIGVEYPSIGEYQGKWFINSLNLGAETGPNPVTAEATLQTSGALAWQAAA